MFVMKTTGASEARAAKARAKVILAEHASVVGIGITRVGEGYGVKVNLNASPGPDANLPKTIDGVPIRIEVVAKIRKRDRSSRASTYLMALSAEQPFARSSRQPTAASP